MALESILVFAGAVIIVLLGTAHLVFTFWVPRLRPRNEEAVAAMRASTLVLTRDQTVWGAWLGFNASHGLGAVFFGATYGYLAVAHAETLFGSWYFQSVGLLFLATYVVLAYRYWFRTPLVGIVVALLCFLAGVVVSGS